MAKLLAINIEAAKDGEIIVNYSNLAGLTDNHLNDAIAFSAPAVLAHQLSVFPVRTGLSVANSADNFAKTPGAKPEPIGLFLDRYHSGYDLKKVPKSFDLSAKSTVMMISKGQSIRVNVKPKLGLLARFPVERMALLVANYQRYVVNLDLGPYQSMVPTAIDYVTNMYGDIPGRLEATLMGNRTDNSVSMYMVHISINLYQKWQTTIHEES